MADTIITNTPDKNDGGGQAGWAVAVIILLVVIVGGYVLFQNGAFTKEAPPKNPDTTNINVTIPNPVTPAPTQNP